MRPESNIWKKMQELRERFHSGPFSNMYSCFDVADIHNPTWVQFSDFMNSMPWSFFFVTALKLCKHIPQDPKIIIHQCQKNVSSKNIQFLTGKQQWNSINKRPFSEPSQPNTQAHTVFILLYWLHSRLDPGQQATEY